ncbi:hypothetical protein [Pseudomonas sp. RIT-PI-q]|uniref:hypothetical protein n=1 Tax=Pseudomonas sp. RIT-PI-q TaxID=1690247 RepID=UPI000A67DA22|nr:hypothetical protein [Pseudomonas sp. RIT-PI-q]
MPWDHILTEYGTAKGVVNTDLQYIVYRGVEPFESVIATVKCNLSLPGPVNPNPEPGNPNLKVVEVIGKSAVPNKLIVTDEDEEVNAIIELVAPLADGDTYQVMWNGTPIGTPYVIDVANDKVGDKIKIELDWDVIRGQGPSATMPVWYVLSNAAHENPQEPQPRTNIDIDWLVFKLPDAVPLHTNPAGIVTCNSLRWKEEGTSYGIQYRIPPSGHLNEGDEVKVVWNAYTDFDNPTLIPTAKKEQTFTNITADQARNGIVWLIEPYATHVLPIWSKALPLGKGEVSYTITGKPASSVPTNTEVGLSQGEGSCNVPPPPNP